MKLFIIVNEFVEIFGTEIKLLVIVRICIIDILLDGHRRRGYHLLFNCTVFLIIKVSVKLVHSGRSRNVVIEQLVLAMLLLLVLEMRGSSEYRRANIRRCWGPLAELKRPIIVFLAELQWAKCAVPFSELKA